MFEVIPAVDVAAGRVVRLTEGDPSRATVYGQNPLEAAQRWIAQGARRIHLVDLDGAWGQTSTAPAVLMGLKARGVAVQIGGGLRDAAAILARLEAGATDAVVGSLLAQPDALRRVVEAVGPDRLIAAIDVRGGTLQVAGWTRAAALSPLEAADLAASLGITRWIVTAVDRDGTERGPDLELTRRFVERGGVVYASGGIGSVEDLVRIKAVGARGAIVGRALYEGRFSLEEARAAVC
ncbi:MAG: 1-(5-phosphoribosyl)-5-[(5-phosphoribosylamino)methylideneamino] imidazole-4-carboxamide isomerase [Actinomycetia bacterium]|nr:1-(5-phosphoribosyl)-5-[(5-phosphoribosylamino)methylideneamino] imidazole-4-carboxamide isomerase [Actinomycetes bacterium]